GMREQRPHHRRTSHPSAMVHRDGLKTRLVLAGNEGAPARDLADQAFFSRLGAVADQDAKRARQQRTVNVTFESNRNFPVMAWNPRPFTRLQLAQIPMHRLCTRRCGKMKTHLRLCTAARSAKPAGNADGDPIDPARPW